MGDSYGRRNFYRPTRQEWANSPQYYPQNMVDPFAMTGGAYGPPSMVRATNMGPPIIPNAFQHIFDKVALAAEQQHFLVRASYLEIYNEEIRDLLYLSRVGY